MIKLTKIICLLAAVLAFSACEREDDIDIIFIGKTWYMNGGTFNGKGMNADVKNFYADGQNAAYCITFNSANTFHGMLKAGIPFSGKWSVDGKKHKISMTFDAKPQTSDIFDLQIYNVLRNAESYESGGNYLFIKQDKDNVVLFGTTRNLPQY